MIYLASQSPRRRELLEQIAIAYKTVSVEIEETPIAGEKPRDYVKRMAIEKATHAHEPGMAFPLLAADTAVVCKERILGKPANKQDFLDMMQLLGNRSHQVFTAIAVISGNDDSGQVIKTRLSSSQVKFRAISASEASLYWQSGEPADKAGGYGIQGLGAVFIEEIQGSYSGIMGLPLFETAELLTEFGVYSL